jgi:uncharacterized protein YutD
MKVVSVQRFKTANIGDRYSSPERYFKWLKVEKHDAMSELSKLKGDVLILGGGGLIDNEDFKINELLKADFKKKIIWGAGHNNHNKLLIKTNPILKEFDLVGIRDYEVGYDWVPCVSCMDQAFDEDYKIKYDYIVYEHQHYPIKIKGFQKKNNNFKTIKEAVSFLGSGKNIVTNTYHGAYWGLLLGRNVLVVSPFSNKFDKLNYNATLGDCRMANIKFSEKVKKVLKSE